MKYLWVVTVTSSIVLATVTMTAQDTPVVIPKDGDGYQITRTDSSQAAPAGFEGRTDIARIKAVGNTSATTGKTVTATLTLGNQIKTCPQADGTAEGEGIFSIVVDSTNAQSDGTSTSHIEMRAKAKYKGQVADDAHLHDPVNAEIDYTYSRSGNFRATNGALTTPSPTNIEQHTTIPVLVSSQPMGAPSFGAFSGGDPTQGDYGNALSAGSAVAYWGGVYYTFAQTKWNQGLCATVVFNPPAHTVQPVLGGETLVSAAIKAKTGESVDADIHADPFSGGYVTPEVGRSNASVPVKFTYTAPSKKGPIAGFKVGATSRAGVALADWIADLGTGWSGQITCTRETSGDEGKNDLQVWSNYELMRITIEVKDGKGRAYGYGEVKGIAINNRYALRGGATVILNQTSSTSQGVVEGDASASVDVTIDKAHGTYSIDPSFNLATGKSHWTSCIEGKCTEGDTILAANPGMQVITEKLDDVNHLRGSRSYTTPNLGRAKNGKQVFTLTWDLARQGTTQ
jgi:hypothetical protein